MIFGTNIRAPLGGPALVLSILSGLAGPASGQDGPAFLMREAAKYCIGNTGRPDLVRGAFESVGFEVSKGMDAGTFEASAPGVWAIMDLSGPRTYCSVQSHEVSIPEAREMVDSIMKMFFPSAKMSGNGPCDGPVVAFNPPLRVTFAAAGNSGECLDDGTSAIIVQ